MSDPFANIPASPNGASTGAEPSISVSDIKDFISPKLYSELSWDEDRTADEVTKDCIDRACVLTKTLLHLVNQEFNSFSKTQKEIIKTLTIYELYIYNGDKAKSRSYMERAERLISNRYGSIEKAREEVSPVISVCNAKKVGVKSNGF